MLTGIWIQQTRCCCSETALCCFITSDDVAKRFALQVETSKKENVNKPLRGFDFKLETFLQSGTLKSKGSAL